MLRAVLLSLCAAVLLVAQDIPAPPPPANHFDLFAHFDTSMGEIVAQLFPERTPVTVENFIALAEGTKPTLTKDNKIAYKHFYDGLEFHRVIRYFMIQTGEVAEGKACGIASIHDEIDSARSFAQPFALAMANAGRPNSASCQIFFTVTSQKSLDSTFTLFGQIVSGQDVATRISEVPLRGEKPIKPVIVKTVTIERRPR